MSLLDKIEQTQKRPEKERRRIFIACMIAGMSIVVAIWIAEMRILLNGDKMAEAETASGPFKIFWSNIQNSAENLSDTTKEEYQKIKDYLASSMSKN